MGIRSQSHLDSSSNVVRVLIDMYVDIGDSIALQYGGSEAHKKVTAGKSESNIMPIGKVRKLDRPASIASLGDCIFLMYSCFHSLLAAQRALNIYSPIL
jgi:hypothetical protein